MQLHTFIDHLALQLRGEQLGLGRVNSCKLLGQVQFGAAVNERPHGGNLSIQLGQGELGVLEVGDSFAKGIAALDVFHRHGQGRFRGSHRRGGDTQPLLGQLLHQVQKAHALLAQEIFLGDLDVGEEQLRGVRSLLAHFVQITTALKALHTPLDQ